MVSVGPASTEPEIPVAEANGVPVNDANEAVAAALPVSSDPEAEAVADPDAEADPDTAAEDAPAALCVSVKLHAPTMAFPTVCALTRNALTLARLLVVFASVTVEFIWSRTPIAEATSATTVLAELEHSMFCRMSVSERCSRAGISAAWGRAAKPKRCGRARGTATAVCQRQTEIARNRDA
jgi:hypothetical protein